MRNYIPHYADDVSEATTRAPPHNEAAPEKSEGKKLLPKHAEQPVGHFSSLRLIPRISSKFLEICQELLHVAVTLPVKPSTIEWYDQKNDIKGRI